MERKTFNRGAMDFLIGMICGAIMHFSMIAYLIVFGLAVAVMLIILARGEDVSTYGNDKDDNFNVMVVLARIVTVNVGVVFGLFAMGMF